MAFMGKYLFMYLLFCSDDTKSFAPKCNLTKINHGFATNKTKTYIDTIVNHGNLKL